MSPIIRSMITHAVLLGCLTGVQAQAKITQLEKVTVTAKKPLFEQKIDRLVINVRSSVTFAGATALDVLERSPGVVVDRQNNSLAMGGKDGVTVMINGRENRMPIDALVQLLAGMSAANIERIELITVPPAGFSAEGNAGIINIVLIQNDNDGTNGSYTGTIGAGRDKMASAALNFNHRKGKINLYGDLSFAIASLRQVFRSYRKIDAGGSTKENQSVNYRSPVTKDFAGRIGMDLQVSKRTTIGAMISGYVSNWEMRSVGQTLMSAHQQLDTVINTNIHEINRWKSLNANLNFYHVPGKDQSITVNFDYLYFHAENPVGYGYTYFTGANDLLYTTEVRSSKLTPIRFFIASADYTRKLGKSTAFQAGTKFTWSGFNNDILVARSDHGIWTTDDGFSASYTLNENIRAGYISINSDLDPKTSVKVGLRYEYTNSVLDTKNKQRIVDRHYGKLFPSVFLSRKLNDRSSINFSYSRRITRPTFNELAPFTLFIDPNSLTTGNPGLQPSLADVLAAGYSYKRYLFSIAYTYDAGAIARFQPKIDPVTNKQVTSSENLKDLRTLALTMSVPVNPTAWWSMQYNLTGRWQRSASLYRGADVKVEQRNFRVTATQTFRLPRSFVLEITGYYQSADLFGRFTRRPFGSFDLGLQKKTGEKGKLSLTATDLFNTTSLRGNINLPEQNLVFSRDLKFSQRQIKLTYTRGFGNVRLKDRRNRIDNSQDERKRVE